MTNQTTTTTTDTTTTDTTHLSEEYVSARNAFGVHAADVRHGPDTLFREWYRMRDAGSRCGTDPTSGVTFSDIVEAVITARISGTPFVLPTGKGK